MVYNCLDVAIDGVFAFDDLYLSFATAGEVLNYFTLFVDFIPDCEDEVWFVVFGLVLWV